MTDDLPARVREPVTAKLMRMWSQLTNWPELEKAVRAELDEHVRIVESLQQRLAEAERAHEEDVADLVKRCACEFDHEDEGSTEQRLLVECAYHKGIREQRDALQRENQEYKDALSRSQDELFNAILRPP